MMTFVILLVAFLLLTLAVIWFHFLRQRQEQPLAQDSYRDQTNVRLYYEHKAEIEADFAQGNIDQEHYQYLLAELNNSLLQDVEASTQAAEVTAPASETAKPLPLVWPFALTAFVLVFSFAVYWQTGAYQQLAEPRVDHNSMVEQQAAQQVLAQVRELETTSQQQPDNSDNWYQLGQAYVSVGNFAGAIQAFDQVIRIEGEQADLYGAKAQVSYYQNSQKITPAVQALIDKALALDALEPSTNILLGMNSFINQRYQQAVDYWQRVIDSGRSNVNVSALTEAVAEAKNRLALTGQVQPGQAQASGVENSNTVGAQLTLNVSVSPELQAQLNQNVANTVFVYAIPASGPRMPVAAVKLLSTDLPAQIVLNDARAMTPQMKLSSVKSVHVYAVISKDGKVGIKSGDLKGELTDVTVGDNKVLDLVINTQID